MLLIGTNEQQSEYMQDKYDQFKVIDYDVSKLSDNDYVINLIETIKSSMLRNDLTYLNYNTFIIKIINKLDFNYNIICKDSELLNDIKTNINRFYIKDNSYEFTLQDKFDWIEKREVSLENIPEDKNKLTFEQLLDDEVVITEMDERSLKQTQNKLKAGMLLQAKNSLNRILKLTNVLDKLYDTLIDRIDVDIENTDTASIMYTADYISKALQDTNKLIMDLITNDKIQNFFIIDNSNNININNESKLDANSREKIRNAATIILDNLDYFQNGEFDKIKDPNKIDVNSVETTDNDNKENK